jgi:CubicO group peptidase (beta-lactamase class C family)
VELHADRRCGSREASMRRLAIALIATLVLVSHGAQAQVGAPSMANTASCGVPVALEDGWPIAKPDETGLDGARLCGIAARLKAYGDNVHSVVVARHGKLVFEQYFAGYDEPWGAERKRYDFDATTKHDVRSITKSVTSLLVGIAAERGLFSLDELVIKFFPEYAAVQSAGWERITLRHLLTMSSGMQWDEARAWTDPKNDEPHLVNDADPLKYVLSKPIFAPPDTVWTYNGGGTDLLGAVIEKASGKPFGTFARDALFELLGITDWEWKNYMNGKIAPAAGLRLRPRDAAKIGQLVLNKGSWNGRQIVSAGWIDDSIKPRFQAIGYFGGLFFYGYQWWIGRTLSDGREIHWIAAQGWGGQRLYIVPELDIVVMTTSAMYGHPREGAAALDILSNFVIPAVRDKVAR